MRNNMAMSIRRDAAKASFLVVEELWVNLSY
jgi:hypothetical protein